MQVLNLGKLERVDLREVWTKEHEDFTPWLAENLHVLSDAIGVEMELETQEKNVGSFRADIVATDINTGNRILIENQLERTDHGHLGQLITYASGLKAATIIWTAYQFTDEHIAALDWLNSITDDSVQFYGLQIELWKIDVSIAPKFNVVCKPNSWLKNSKNYTRPVKGFDRKAFVYEALKSDPSLSLNAIRVKALQEHNATISKGTISQYRTLFFRGNKIQDPVIAVDADMPKKLEIHTDPELVAINE